MPRFSFPIVPCPTCEKAMEPSGFYGNNSFFPTSCPDSDRISVYYTCYNCPRVRNAIRCHELVLHLVPMRLVQWTEVEGRDAEGVVLLEEEDEGKIHGG